MNTLPIQVQETFDTPTADNSSAIKIVTITPEIAKRLLEINTANRPLNEAHVRSLAREMEAGKWQFNGDPIRFSGRFLLDGQHRLEACVRSEKAFTAVVISGLSDDVFATIDIGVRRNAAHTLAVAGEQNTSKLAAALRFVNRYTTGRMGKTVKLSNTEVQDELHKHPGLRESVDRFAKLPTKLIPLSVLSGLHYLFSMKDRALADTVVEQVIHGVGLLEGDAVHILRERLVANAASKSSLSEDYIAALFIKAWNSVRTQTPLKSLRYREGGAFPEDFPQIQ